MFGCLFYVVWVWILVWVCDIELYMHVDFHEFMGVVFGWGEYLLIMGVEELCAGDVVLVWLSDWYVVCGLVLDGFEFVNVVFLSSIW